MKTRIVLRIAKRRPLSDVSSGSGAVKNVATSNGKRICPLASASGNEMDRESKGLHQICCIKIVHEPHTILNTRTW